MNNQIRIREVRVITDDGEQLGVMPTFQALQLAQEKGLDLVEVAPTAVPPVCRIMDYGRFRFEQEKKEREAKRTQRSTSLSEIRFRPRIAVHDREAKLRHARELLTDRHKVKLSIMFRGREMQHPERGVQILKALTEALKDDGKLEAAPLMEGRFLSLILAPLPKRETKAASEGQTSEQEAKGAEA